MGFKKKILLNRFKKIQLTFIVNLKMVCVNQNRFLHYYDDEKRKQAQPGAEIINKCIFSLSVETHSSHGLWGLLLTPQLSWRAAKAPFGELCTRLSKASGFLGTTASERSFYPHFKRATGWNPLGHSLLSFYSRKCYVQILLTFIVSFLSCFLKTEKAVSEHAILPI